MSIRKTAEALGLKKVSSMFNFYTSIRLNNKRFRVPIVHNMGFLNLTVKEDFFLQLFKSIRLSENACFIDVGVNVGQTLLKFRSCSNNAYIGFEPNPGCVHYLETLIKANKMPNTTIIPVGLSSTSEVAKFYLKSGVDAAGTIVNELRPDYYTAEDVNYVPVFTLDSLDITGGRPIELIKIDVEGAESEVLLGMTETIKKHRPAIICEILDSHNAENTSRMQARADKLVAHMNTLNYRIYRIIHEGTKITPEEITEVKLKQWVPESWNLNDYLFLPNEVSYNDVVKL